MSLTGQLLHNEKDASLTIGLERIRRRSADISCLVYDALYQAAAEAPAQGNDDSKEPTDVVDFCRRIIGDVRKSGVSGKQEITFRTDTPAIYIDVDLPGFYPPFRSFISRAVDLVDIGGVVMLKVSADGRAGQVLISLEMPTHTIPADKLPFVFYRYRQSCNTHDDSGSINEIAVLKDFAEHAGGSFRVESDTEHGTRFCLTLPCKAAAVQQRTSQHAVQVATPNAGGTPTEADRATPDMTDSGLLDSITKTIETYMSDSDFNVAKLAAGVGIGDKSLYRRVKQLTGNTPVELIRQIRMQRASLLLREGKFSVSEVMYLVGYQNSSYFSKCFSKTYGITPAEYSRKAFL